MSVQYCIIARDSDMVVFESLVNKDFNPRQLLSEALEVITMKEKDSAHLIAKMNNSMNKSTDLEN